MSKIVVITAANEKFKDLANMTAASSRDLGYETLVYDLGGLGTGIPFEGRVFDQVGGKIPSKPNIILDALNRVDDNDFVVWLDADAILWESIDEIVGNYDIGVTVRKPKTEENGFPINAGVVFIKKTEQALNFVHKWVKECETATSDQAVLNGLCEVTSLDTNNIVLRNNTKIQVFPCDVYNNFYFKLPQLHAKITHYKSKLRSWWPRRTIQKIPKNADEETRNANTQLRFNTTL